MLCVLAAVQFQPQATRVPQPVPAIQSVSTPSPTVEKLSHSLKTVSKAGDGTLGKYTNYSECLGNRTTFTWSS